MGPGPLKQQIWHSRRLVSVLLRGLGSVVAVWAVFVLAPGAAGAAGFSWAAPMSVSHEPFSQAGTFVGISCPSTSLCVGVDNTGNAVTSTDPTATTPTWTTDEIDPNPSPMDTIRPPGLQGISCPSTTLCAAVDAGGTALISTNPTNASPTWTPTNVDAGFIPTGISCASLSLCVAVDNNGRALVSTDPTAASPSWSTADIDGTNSLQSVTCPATSLCVAVDAEGRVLITNNPSAADVTWTTTDIAGTAALSSVSCPSTSLCIAGGNGNAFISADPTDASPTWTESTNIQAGGVLGVSCVSGSFCVAVGGEGNASVSTDPTAATPTWTTSNVDGSAAILVGVSCISGSGCVAVDSNGREVVLPDPSASASSAWAGDSINPAGSLSAVSCTAAPVCAAIGSTSGGSVVEVSTDPTAATPTWNQSVITGVALTGISCSSTFCAAVDTGGDVFVSTDPTAATPTWTKTNIDNNELTAVSCVSATFCAAVDPSGYAFVSTDPTDATPTWKSTDIDPGQELSAISCESASLCVATNPSGENVGPWGQVLISTNPTAATPTWTPDRIDANSFSGPGLGAVSCPSTSLCVAVDTRGDAMISTNPTRVSPTWRTIDIDGSGSLVSVSCPSTSSCVAVDSAGNAVILSDPASATPTWQAANFDSAANAESGVGSSAVSCPTAALCVAVDALGSVFSSTTPAAGAPSWTSSWVDGVNSIAQTSCVSTSFCAAVDDDGNVLVSADPTDPAPSWTTTNIDGPTNLTGISCPSASFCVATDADGNALISTDPGGADPSWASSNIEGAGGLLGVSCPSTGLCLASGSSGLLISNDPTAADPTWTIDAIGIDPYDVSCPSTSFCAVAGNDAGEGEVLTSTDPTAPSPNWTSATVDGNLISGVSCPSTLMCADGDTSGDVSYATDPTAPDATWVDDGGLESSAVGGISCPSVGFCVATYNDAFGGVPEYAGYALVITNPASPNPTLTPTDIDGNAPVAAISCVSVSLCIAGGSNGQLIVGQGSGFPSAPVNTAPPTIPGPASNGVTLTANPGSWTNDPATFLYQWEDCDNSGNNCTPISGANAQSYTPTAGEVGSTLKVEVTASDVGATSAPVDSAAAAVMAATPPVPVNTAAPTISGVATQGQALSEAHGSWTNSPTSYTYQWSDCDTAGNNCAAIPGATNQTYTLTGSDVGDTIRVREIATDSGGNSSPATSAASGVVQPLSEPPTKPSNSSPPVVSGTATAGQTLTTSTGVWEGTPPISYSYQWQLCNPGCSNIATATSSSLALTTADVGGSIRAVVTATNSAGSGQATSGEIGPVTAAGSGIGTGGAGGPTVGQVKAALLAGLAISGKAATIAHLLADDGYLAVFIAPSAGELVIDWYYVPAGAHLANVKRPELVASARAALDKAGKTKVKIKLTASGRRLLKGTKHVRLTAKGSFTPAGGTKTTTTKTIKP